MTSEQQKHKPKQSKIRYTEYYDLQSIFDSLYADSLNGKTFQNLMHLMASEENIKLSTMRHMGGTRGSTRAGTSPLAVMSRGDIPLRSTTTDWRTFPTNTGYSPCLKYPSGSKWPPIRKWRTGPPRPRSGPRPRWTGRSGSPLDTVSRGRR